MTDRRLATFLVVVGAVAVVGFALVFVESESADRASLRAELGKAAIQIIVVAVIGTVLKLLVDRHQVLAQRAEQDQRFRLEKYDRLVGVTNDLRRVPVMIDANRSVKTWSTQMTVVLDAGLRLRALRHEIHSTRFLEDPPFTSHVELAELLETMYHYTDWVVGDFTLDKKRLSELQLRAEAATGQQRAALQDEVWGELLQLPTVEDMHADLADGDDVRGGARVQRRQDVTTALRTPATSGNRLASLSPSWLTYLECESVALELMTQATLARPQQLRQ